MTGHSGEAKDVDAAEKELLERCNRNGAMLYYDPRTGLAVWEADAETKQLCQAVPHRSYRAADGSDIVRPAGETEDGLNQAPLAGPSYPAEVIAELNSRLLTPGCELRKAVTYASQQAFVYFDISDFSSKKPGVQLLTLNSLLWLLRNERFWQQKRALKGSCANRICIGDGFIFVFDRCEDAVAFAAYLACLVEATNRYRAVEVLGDLVIHYRVGIHFDWVFHFWDDYREGKMVKGRRNYTGSGINGGRRVLDAIGPDLDDVVFLSYEVMQQLEDPACLRCLVNKGTRKDKHQKRWRVYQLNHIELAWGWLPTALVGDKRSLRKGR